jgi:hypothetical protein
VLAALSKGTEGTISLTDTSFLNHIDERLALPFLQGYSSAMSLTFLCGTAVLAIGLVLVAFLPRVTLRQVSGLEQQRADEAALAEVTLAAELAQVAGPAVAAPAVAGPAQTGAPEATTHRDRLRDRLLGLLIPDLDGALATLAVAERARDDARRAHGEVTEHAATLIEARRELIRHGLTGDQINELLLLSPAEAARTSGNGSAVSRSV